MHVRRASLGKMPFRAEAVVRPHIAAAAFELSRHESPCCRAQIAMLQERLRQVETAAAQAHRLHAALLDAAVVLQRPDAGAQK